MAKNVSKVNSWKELTLREKIGQTVVCLCETDKHVEMCGSIENFLKKYPVGGIFNSGELVTGLLVGANSQFKDIVNEYNKYSRVPLFGVADHGSYASANGVTLPPQMALGATNDRETAYRVGQYKAEDYKKSGVHWGFWPVCDMNISKHSPVTDTRAVSDNPELTCKIVKEEIDAMKASGVIATIKHFPGPPYDEYIDAHLAPFDNNTPIDLWRSTYGKIYKSLIDAGVPSIMTAHVNLTDYQTEKIDGIYPPATMSYELTTKLLREELGFKGVTVTDALVMGGFSGAMAVENTIQSFLSGNDVLLWPTYEYIDEMEKRILSGEIDEKLLDAAVERIWNLKQEYGILAGNEFSSDRDIDFFEDIARDVCDKCLTLINNYENLLPLDKSKTNNVLIIGVTPDDRQYDELCCLKTEFEKYGCNVKMRRNIWTNDIYPAAENNDLILFALCRTVHRPMGPLDFWGAEASSIWASNCSDKRKTVIASFGTPYLYRYYQNSGMTYINAYSSSKYIIQSFVKAIFGEIGFDGKSSITLSY